MAEKQEKPSAPKKAAESVYTAQELAAGHKAFGAPKELVTVALRLDGREVFTLPEAKRIVETFNKKEV